MKQARLAAQFSTQESVVKHIKRSNKKVALSQGLVAQYEKGDIQNPSPTLLRLFSSAYNVDYVRFVLAFISDKYLGVDKTTTAGVRHWRMQLWQASLKRFREIARIPQDQDIELEEFQLKAKAILVEHFEVLDLQGLMEWQRRFCPKEIWVLLADYKDEQEPIRSATVKHIKDGTRINYLVQAGTEQEGGGFWRMQRTIVEAGAPRERVDEQMIPIPLEQAEVGLFEKRMVILNPNDIDSMTGFRILQFGGEGPGHTIAIRIDTAELKDIVNTYSPWLFKKYNARQRNFEKLKLPKVPSS
ncbi:MAG: hypothetical protein IPL32_03885 [Chloracidobacterium sp.]|nr:hypothetical protein [Chloracidobacterium sp.]